VTGAVVFVPSAPFLLLGAGPADLRVCLDEALALLTGDVVVVGAAPRPGWWEGSVDLTPYGVRVVPADEPLPLALAVGRTLLGARPHRLWGVAADGSPSEAPPEADSLLVVADGTAKRSEKAPGHLDPRAEAFDHAVATALDAADAAALLALDPGLASELWVGGLAAWRAAAAVPGPWQGTVTYAQAPYGVGYVVATWTR
jgi:hypothetical protein